MAWAPRTWPRQALIGVVLGYRYLLKPWLGNACRFEPSCSQYALDALRRHGAAAGATLTAGRLLRCHPWCDGGLDPVPARAPGLFTRLGLGADADPAPAAAADDTASPPNRTLERTSS
jgi:putative membrane protein insertion efficiency factor